MSHWKKTLSVIALFVALTIFMTYPLSFHMGSSLRGTFLRDIGDPLLNTWILSWNIHKITTGDVKNYFDANIFYPHRRTLAYSECFFPQSLIALPVLLVSKNPILAYNFVLFFAFISSALGMYFFASFLTKNNLAGILAGIIYAFSPFMIDHLFHVQVLTAGGIPLSFLFLHKYFDSNRLRDFLFFALFYILQALSNIYYAFYLALIAGLFILIQSFLTGLYRKGRFWMKLGFCLIIISAVVGPFFYQYIQVHKEMGFERHIGAYARLTSFLATPSINRLYGRLTAAYHRPEAELFPGVIAFLLALAGVIFGLKQKKEQKIIWIYSGILIFSFLFTLGPNGPYLFLHKYVPGFKAIRVAARFDILVMFSLAILAAYGARVFLNLFKKWKRHVVAVLLICIILAEYLSIPLPLMAVLVKDQIPEVYKWLGEKKREGFAFLEIPLPPLKKPISYYECLRIYYSAYHWKNLVNGYSGFFPPFYNELIRRWQKLPLKENIKSLKDLRIRYIIFHSSFYENSEEISRGIEELSQLKQDLHFVIQLGEAYVFEIVYQPGERSDLILSKNLKPLPKLNWKAASNINHELVAFAVDGKLSTVWKSDSQKKGDYFELDLGKIQKVRGISLMIGQKALEYPRSYKVQVSADGIHWKKVAKAQNSLLPLRAFLKPRDISLDIVFSPENFRYLRIIITGKNKNPWSLAELEVLE